MDTKFSVAIHVMILISEAEKPMNSDMMAKSIGTNSSYVRKIIAKLKNANIVENKGRNNGYCLCENPADITLLSIYRAVENDLHPHLFDIHLNPNDKCLVGRYIRPTLNGVLERVENEVCRSLAKITLADCIDNMKNLIATQL